MKFGKQLRYECVSEWRSKYISYGKLKKYLRFLYVLSKKQQQIDGTQHFSPNNNPEATNSDNPIKFDTIHVSPPMPATLAPNAKTDSTDFNNTSTGEDNERKPLLEDNNNGGSELNYNTLLNSSVEKEHLFMSKIKDEIKKINEFFTLKEKDIILHYNKLTEHCGMILKDNNPSPKVLKNIQKAFAELYKGLTMLENFVTLNHQGFCKIFKKFDKLAGKNDKEKNKEEIEKERFYQSKSWRNMKEDVELLYCKIFKIDKLASARNKLRPVSESQSADYHMMKLGFAIGFSLALLVVIIILFISPPVIQNPDWVRFVSVVPIFRAVAIPILAVWFWGVNVFIWEKQRVNHVLIFGFDPRTSVDHRRIFKTASFLTSIWLLMFLLFCGTITGNFRLFQVPAEVYPPALVVFFLIVAFFPFRFFHRKSRLLLFITLGNVIMTPFGSTKFRALYLGDVLTSMVKTIFDWEYTACYFVTGDWMIDSGGRCNDVNRIALPIISGLPLLWRFMQCLLRYRETKNKIHIGNASKYAVGFTVVLFSSLAGNYLNYPEPWTPARILWCICFILATMYMYVWDVLVDWGFMWMGSPRPLLRQSLMYKRYLPVYYYALLSNFVFRFAWTLSISPLQIEGINNELFVTILATVELFRRFTWSVFRVENEHITNSLQYHAFDFSDAPWKDEIKQQQLLQQQQQQSLLAMNADLRKNASLNGSTSNISSSLSAANSGLSDPDYVNSSNNWYNAASHYYSKNSMIDSKFDFRKYLPWSKKKE